MQGSGPPRPGDLPLPRARRHSSKRKETSCRGDGCRRRHPRTQSLSDDGPGEADYRPARRPAAHLYPPGNNAYHRAGTMDANMKEAERWLRQGERDLLGARNSCRSGNFEWACFQAQQSAEKSLKALLYARGFRRILTHSVYELIREVGQFEPSFLELKAGAKALDSAYIMARYPDSIVGNLTPSEYYDREDAGECIGYADSICNAARQALAG